MIEHIRFTLDEGDNQIEIRTYKLAREEIDKLSEALQDFSWEVEECSLEFMNRKHTQWWTFDFPFDYDVELIREWKEKLLKIINEIVPTKSIKSIG